MQPETAAGFSPEEVEILRELVNIAFGAASAALAARLGQGVELTVPDVQVMPAVLLRYYVGAELKDQPTISVVEQGFRGKLAGRAFLVLPPAVGGALVEAGPVLIRACLEKLAELVGAPLALDPPTTTLEAARGAAVRADLFPAGEAAVLRNAFQIAPSNARGYLFLAVNPECLPWLEQALHGFMARYA
jgi:chemotaxis protein CheC